MNWITKNNYTIKRKFNQINNKRGNKELKKAFNIIDENNKKNMNKNQINFNINCSNQGNNNNINSNFYRNIYYQINQNETLEQQLRKGESFVQSNLNNKYILLELNEF